MNIRPVFSGLYLSILCRFELRKGLKSKDWAQVFEKHSYNLSIGFQEIETVVSLLKAWCIASGQRHGHQNIVEKPDICI